MRTQFDFREKVGVIGASGLIGMAIALRFHQTSTAGMAAKLHEDAPATPPPGLAERRDWVVGNLVDAAHGRSMSTCTARLGGMDTLMRCLAVHSSVRGIRAKANTSARIPHSNVREMNPGAFAQNNLGMGCSPLIDARKIVGWQCSA